jgi:esterase/lipase superfamily enzyme
MGMAMGSIALMFVNPPPNLFASLICLAGHYLERLLVASLLENMATWL